MDCDHVGIIGIGWDGSRGRGWRAEAVARRRGRSGEIAAGWGESKGREMGILTWV